MFIPIYDGVPLRRLKAPVAVRAIILLNFAILLVTMSGALGGIDHIGVAGGVIPAVVFGEAVRTPELSIVPPSLTFLTFMFLHAGFWHFAGNMVFLWVFGDNVEDAMGSGRFIAFYLCCGVLSALAHTWMNTDSQAPLVGASGAVAGVLAAYLLLYPRVKVFGLIFTWLPIVLPAWLFIGAWIAAQIGSAFFVSGGDVGWWAHVGGVLSGVLLAPLFKQADVPLFGAGPPQRFLPSP